MDFDAVHREVIRQIDALARWDVQPTLIVVGERVHYTIMEARMAVAYGMYRVAAPNTKATFLGVPYTVGVHVALDYLKVLCEAPTPTSLASNRAASSRRYDRANSPRIGEPPQPSH